MKIYRFLVIMLCFFFCQNTFAQDPTLFETTWTLLSVTVNGEEFFPPSNEEVPSVELIFEEDVSGVPFTMSGCVCDCLYGEPTFQEPSNSLPTMDISNFTTTLAGCDEGGNGVFQGRYFSFFVNALDDPFEYFTTFIDDDNIALEIISSTGDIAIYNGATLSVSDFKTPSFSIYPNPAQEHLYINADQYIGEYTIAIFDIQGRQLLSTSKDILGIRPIAIQDWRAGIYLVKIEDASGTITTKRFIKK